MPAVDSNTGQPISDDPEQENQDLAGGKGRGENVDAHGSPAEGTGISTGPNNAREAQPGATQGDDAPDLDSADAGSGSV